MMTPITIEKNNGVETKAITLGGYRHRYIEAGSGDETLLLVHGFSSSLEAFELVVPALATSRRVLAIDLLGFGGSEKPTQAPYSLALYSDLLQEFLEQTNATGAGKKVYAAGHSMGGKILLAFAVLFPKSLDKLVLIDTDGFLHVPAVVRVASVWGVRHLLRKLIGRESFIRKTMQSVYHDPAVITDEHFQRNLSMVRDRENFEAIMALNRNYRLLDLKRTGIRKRLGELKLPVLIMWGEQDRFVHSKYAAVAQREITHASLCLIPNCGHIPMVETPDIFVKSTEAFLKA